MHYILTAIGSYGDVHPLVGLGKRLRERGHDVEVVSNPHFASLIERSGLKFVGLASSDDYRVLTENPDLWHPLRGPRIALTESAKFAAPLYEIISQRYRRNETIVAAHMLDLGSRVAHERLGVPLAGVYLSPIAFRSNFITSRVPGMLWHSRVPRWFKRAQHWCIDRLVLDRCLAPVNQLRRKLGLSPNVSRFYNKWVYAPQLALGMFPEWLAAPQPDWPANSHLVGFPLWDESEHGETAAAVREFLAAGDRPVVFTPGSAMAFGRDLLTAGVKACESLGLRSVLLTRYAANVPTDLPNSCRHFEFVPLSQILPHAAALVHHGGIGTSGQAVAAGVPQLIHPLAFDQHDNVNRLANLKLATELSPRQFTPLKVRRALSRLLVSEEIRTQCDVRAAQCDGRAALDAACDLLESLHESAPTKD